MAKTYHCNYVQLHCSERYALQCLACRLYQRGTIKPHYPVPAIQTKQEFDYSVLTPGKVLGLNQWERAPNDRAWLVNYWVHE